MGQFIVGQYITAKVFAEQFNTRLYIAGQFITLLIFPWQLKFITGQLITGQFMAGQSIARQLSLNIYCLSEYQTKITLKSHWDMIHMYAHSRALWTIKG